MKSLNNKKSTNRKILQVENLLLIIFKILRKIQQIMTNIKMINNTLKNNSNELLN